MSGIKPRYLDEYTFIDSNGYQRCKGCVEYVSLCKCKYAEIREKLLEERLSKEKEEEDTLEKSEKHIFTEEEIESLSMDFPEILEDLI